MAAATDTHLPPRLERWLSRWTTLQDIERSLIDEPSTGLSAWARTTAGVVVMLLAVQLLTGVLLAFYYVPSAESAHTTVSYIEKVLPAGSWLRAVHHYGSQWLTLALVIHLAQMFWRATYRRRPVAWMASVMLLMLVLAEGATGYSLPWDARAFFGTRVAEGIAGGLARRRRCVAALAHRRHGHHAHHARALLCASRAGHADAYPSGARRASLYLSRAGDGNG